MSEMHESAENYLETILILKNKNGSVRSIDIVRELGFSKPSVSVAMKKLRESGHITMDADGMINLSDSGRKIANAIYERHRVLSDWLISLGVNEGTATDDACKIEHYLSEESFQKIQEHILSGHKLPSQD